VDCRFVGEKRKGCVRADDRPGEQIAEHDGLAEPLKNDRGDRRHTENECDVDQEVVGVVHQLTGVERLA
jgi:hypothetical protein